MTNNNYILTSTGSFISYDELYHHGIKGMKWGVRKYQNPDGSLTAAGKSKYTNTAESKAAYKNAKKVTQGRLAIAKGMGVRLTATKSQRREYSQDMQSYNNSLSNLVSAKYDHKITKAQLKGKNSKVAKLRVKQELKVKQQKNRTSIANMYLKDTYEKQSAGKAMVRGFIGGNKGTVNALVKAGYSKRGAKFMSYIFNDNANLSFAYRKSDKNIEKEMKKRDS